MHYLRLMGIEVWRLRSPVLNGYYRYDLLDPQNRVVGVIVADAVLCNEAESQLVEKIAKATKKQIRGGFQTDSLKQENFDQDVIVLLGSRMVDSLANFDQSRTIVSYSPAELLNDTALKAKTWEDLKKAMQLMDP